MHCFDLYRMIIVKKQMCQATNEEKLEILRDTTSISSLYVTLYDLKLTHFRHISLYM